MSAPLLEAAFAARAPSPTDKLVLLALARRAEADGAAPTVQRELMAVTGLSERAVRDAQAALERAGLLTRGRGGCRLHLADLPGGSDRQLAPVAEENRHAAPVETAPYRHAAPVEASDRHVAPVLDAAALRQAVAAEAGEWRAQTLFDTGQLDGGVLYARSLVTASKLRNIRAVAGIEVRVGPKPAGGAGCVEG